MFSTSRRAGTVTWEDKPHPSKCPSSLFPPVCILSMMSPALNIPGAGGVTCPGCVTSQALLIPCQCVSMKSRKGCGSVQAWHSYNKNKKINLGGQPCVQPKIKTQPLWRNLTLPQLKPACEATPFYKYYRTTAPFCVRLPVRLILDVLKQTC